METGKKNQEKENKEGDDKDKRTEKEEKADLKKGMKLGAAVVNNEQLNQDQIKVELNKLELKYRLDDLGAKLLQETAEWHTFMLKGRLSGQNKSEEIKRKPTKAENEEDVSEEDRKKHKMIADAVEQKLQSINPSGNNPSFEEFYNILKIEANQLIKVYQPQLRKGIKLTVDLINDVKKDKQDGDIDIHIKIAPNTEERNINREVGHIIPLNEEVEKLKVSDEEIQAQLEAIANLENAKEFVFRGDDEYTGGGIGIPINSVEAQNADIQKPSTHVQDKENDETSIFSSFSLRRSIDRGTKGPIFFAKKIYKVTWQALEELVITGQVKIYTPEMVAAILRKGKKKERRQAENVKAAMEKHMEVLIEGHIPEEYLLKSN